MATQMREEICSDCGWTRDRVWIVKTLGKGVALPKGFHVEKRSQSGDWRTIAAPTRDTTLCGCDTP